ncbi:hypothetical protein ACI48J_00655 [Paenibacillus chitinolyticus]|uniref:hypothetical protein n=1 Tax=Paenibacillus chitinolyticus TaxID=79263 RepID=UPI00386DE406
MPTDENLSDPSLIHERCGRRMEPFYWILTFEALALLLLSALALAAGPVYLVVTFRHFWSYMSLLLIIPGLWLIRFSILTLKAYIWKNRHLDRYSLYRDDIRYLHYEQAVKEEDAVRLDEVDRVYIAYYVAQYHYAYKKTKWFESQSVFHLLPMLYVRYRRDAQERILKIPFYELPDLKKWLKHFKQRGSIEIWATDLLLEQKTEAEQLSVLRKPLDTSPFDIEKKGFKKRLDNLLYELGRKRSERERASQEPSESFGGAKTIRARSGTPQPQRPLYRGNGSVGAGGAAVRESSTGQGARQESSRKPRMSTVVIFALLFASLYVLTGFVVDGRVSPDNMWLCIGCFLAAAAAYFVMADRLTFWHAVRFTLAAFIGWVLAGAIMPLTDTGAGGEFYSTAIGATILLPLTIWLPFGMVCWIRRQFGLNEEEEVTL